MLFRRDIEPACMYCGRGKRINDREIYCAKRGAVPAESSCPAFRYDPLKRTPPRPVSLPAPRFRLADFSLSNDPPVSVKEEHKEKTELLPTVLQAVPGENFTVYAYFNDGSVRLADIKPMIAKGGVFAPLSDETFFRERLTVMNGAVAWDIAGNYDNTRCVDLDPWVMYRESPKVPDPLAE